MHFILVAPDSSTLPLSFVAPQMKHTKERSVWMIMVDRYDNIKSAAEQELEVIGALNLQLPHT